MARSDLTEADVNQLPDPVDRARSVQALLAAVTASDPGRPRVTWYGPDDERVELSASVLSNWVAKTGNLLVEECGVEPGHLVRVSLPPHWRAVVCDLAAWSVGARLATADDHDDDVDAHFTTHPPPGSVTATVVAVALPALARTFDPGPGDWTWEVDYAAEVTGFADEPGYAVDDDPHGVLAAARAARDARGWAPGERVLVTASAYDPVEVVLAALCADGSVVLVDDTVGDVERVVGTEQVSSTA